MARTRTPKPSVEASLDALATLLGHDAQLAATTSGERDRWAREARDLEELHERHWDLTYRLLFVSAVLAIPASHRPAAIEALVAHAHARFTHAAADRVAGLAYEAGVPAGHQLDKRLRSWRIFDGLAMRAFQPLSSTEVQRALAVAARYEGDAAGTDEARDAPEPRDLREPAIEAAIFEDPLDPLRYSVYADWLQERGDPRGELIALQIGGERDPDLRAKARGLLERHAEYFIGPLAPHLQGHTWRPRDAFAWRFGFIHTARISCALRHEQSKLRGVTPQAMLRELLTHPSGRFVVELEVNQRNHPSLQPVIDLLAARVPAALRVLVLGEEAGGAAAPVGDLSRAWPALARLRELAINGSCKLGSIALPAATHVALRVRDSVDDAFGELATAHWPSLRRLELDCADSFYGRMHAVPYFASLDLPALEELALPHCAYADALAEALAASPGRTRLRRLSLAGGELTARGASALCRSGMVLEELDIRRCAVPRDALRLLRAIAPKIDPRDQRA